MCVNSELNSVTMLYFEKLGTSNMAARECVPPPESPPSLLLSAVPEIRLDPGYQENYF